MNSLSLSLRQSATVLFEEDCRPEDQRYFTSQGAVQISGSVADVLRSVGDPPGPSVIIGQETKRSFLIHRPTPCGFSRIYEVSRWPSDLKEESDLLELLVRCVDNLIRIP